MKYIYYCLIITIFFSCKKQEVSELDSLSPLTTDEIFKTQNYNFGCLIDENVFIPKVYNGGWTGQKSIKIRIFNDSIKKIRIEAKLENKEDDYYDQRIMISFSDFKGIGKYELIDSNSYPSFVFPTFYDPTSGANNTTHHNLVPNFENNIEVSHFDETKKIIAGKFHFTVSNGSKMYSISEGRFFNSYE
jgi:hypothetical protein